MRSFEFENLVQYYDGLSRNKSNTFKQALLSFLNFVKYILVGIYFKNDFLVLTLIL